MITRQYKLHEWTSSRSIAVNMFSVRTCKRLKPYYCHVAGDSVLLLEWFLARVVLLIVIIVHQ